MTEQDFPLPPLNPFLKLYKASGSEGEPGWSLHNPVSNSYYKIAWAEFECLARFPMAKTALDLKRRVEAETTLSLDLDEIKKLLIFLQSNGLLALGEQSVSPAEKLDPLWKKILHSYLYFTIPLFESENFLKRTLPLVAPLLTRGFIMMMMGLLSVALLMTMQRSDEFFHSFTQFLSLDGVIQGLIVLIFTKIVHELSHAYTATKYGVPVPHIGIAVIVLYPVLYTETTGSWQLSSRKERFYIGMAGIIGELCLAAIFLMLWNFAPAGSSMQGIAFTVVAISLVGSLLINLNPLMRFDGYYMMSDLSGIENLQHRSIAFARRKIRNVFFAIDEEVPEHLPAHKENFLTVFGLSLLAYRFILFTGIAVLVYHMFFKPLGLFLFVVEICWFIVLPIWAELKIWWDKRNIILKTRRTHAMGLALFILCLFAIIPWQKTVTLAGVLHSAHYAAIYPYAPSYIEEVSVSEGQKVTEGSVLVRLSSDDFERKFTALEKKIEAMQRVQSRVKTDPGLLQEKYADLALQIETLEKELAGMKNQRQNFLIKAPFAGVVRDLSPEIKAGRYVQRTDLLLRLIEPDAVVATGYVAEGDLTRIAPGDSAIFIPDNAPLTSWPLTLEKVAATDIETLPWPELSSFHKGPVAAQYNQVSGDIIPIGSYFAVDLIPPKGIVNLPDMVMTGQIRVSGRTTSPIIKFFKGLGSMLMRESGMN